MILATYLTTKNDAYGNPRRLYIVSEVKEGSLGVQRLDVIQENYRGRAALLDAYPNAIIVNAIEVTPSEYNRWVKIGKNDRKLREE